MTPIAVPGRIGRRDAAALATLVVAGVGVPLLLSAAAGAIGIPSTDDWVYIRGADSLFRTGAIAMPAHTAASIGQLVLVQPLLWLSRGNTWAFTAFGLIMAGTGLASTYLLARRFVGFGSAAMVVLSVEAFPGFAREAATFMTDVPTFALITLCLLVGTRWLQGEGRRATLVASLGVGLLAVTIREFAIAAPAAILVVAWARSRPQERVWLAVVSGVFAVAVACVILVARSLSGSEIPLAPQLLWLAHDGQAFATLAAVLLPAIVLGLGRRMPTLHSQQVIAGAALVCLAFAPPIEPLVGQLWMSEGLVGDALLSGTRVPVIGRLAWGLSEQVALFSAILLAALVLRWGQRNLARITSLSTAVARAIRLVRSRDGALFLFLVAYAVELAVVTAMTYPQDRYLYPMVAPAAILLLRGPARPIRLGRRHAFSHAALAWLAVSAFVIAANAFAYDAARWRAGEAAVGMGYDAGTVDAGYEWVGYHASGIGNSRWADYGLTWYDDALLTHRPCAVVSNSPLQPAGFTLLREDRSAYRQYLFFGPEEPLYLYGSTTSGCPTPPGTIAARKPLAGREYTSAIVQGSSSQEASAS